MDDPELAEIRAQRFAEMQARQAAARAGRPHETDKAKREQDDGRDAILNTILSQESRARLGRIAAVKPDKAQAVEDTILSMYKQGSFTRMDDKMLVRLLDSVATHDTAKRPEIRVVNRRKQLDSDDDFDD